MHNIELFCLEIMDYNLNDLSSFSILQIILNNGILLENEILEKWWQQLKVVTEYQVQHTTD